MPAKRAAKGQAAETPGAQYLISRPGSSVWHVRFRIGGVIIRESTRTENRLDAAAYALKRRDEVYAEVQLGTPMVDHLTVTEAFKKYYVEVCEASPAGKSDKRFHMAVLVRVLGEDTKLADLTNKRINEAVQALRNRPITKKGQPERLSDSAINRYLDTLNLVCKRAGGLWGVQVGDWKRNDFRLAEPKGRQTYLNHEQARALLRSAVGHMRPVILLELLTGMRLKNVTGLQWDEVNLDTGDLYVVQKGDQDLTVQLPPQAVQLLASLQPDDSKRVGAVFRYGNPYAPCDCPRCANKAGRYDGQPFITIKRAFNTARKNAGLNNLKNGRLRFHDLRHTFATWLLTEAEDLSVVKEALGHKHLTTTARYAHVLPGRTKTAVNDAAAQWLSPTVMKHEKRTASTVTPKKIMNSKR